MLRGLIVVGVFLVVLLLQVWIDLGNMFGHFGLTLGVILVTLGLLWGYFGSHFGVILGFGAPWGANWLQGRKNMILRDLTRAKKPPQNQTSKTQFVLPK